MDQIDYVSAIARVAQAGWAYRDMLIEQGPLTQETVKLELALHELDQSLAKLTTSLSRLPRE